MNFDAEAHLDEVERSVSYLERDGKPASAVTLTRTFPTTAADLWDAVTNRQRLPRWFTVVSGKLELGGRYQVEGNASGTITACEPLAHYALTWEFGGDVSWVDVHLTAAGANGARLALTHTALLSPFWDQYGPGAVGVGWEMAFLGLALHIADPEWPKPDEMEFATSADGKAFITGSSDGWAQAAIASGTDPGVAQAAAKQTVGVLYRRTGQTPTNAKFAARRFTHLAGILETKADFISVPRDSLQARRTNRMLAPVFRTYGGTVSHCHRRRGCHCNRIESASGSLRVRGRSLACSCVQPGSPTEELGEVRRGLYRHGLLWCNIPTIPDGDVRHPRRPLHDWHQCKHRVEGRCPRGNVHHDTTNRGQLRLHVRCRRGIYRLRLRQLLWGRQLHGAYLQPHRPSERSASRHRRAG